MTNDRTPHVDTSHLDVKSFAAVCAQTAVPGDCPLAERVESNVPIYTGDSVRRALADPADEATLRAEWSRVLRVGPGVFVVSGAYDDVAVVDAMTQQFMRIVAEEAAGGGRGDHFGSNERIWNSIEKVCRRAPDLFIDYYGNPVLATASLAWLGPFYQITAQVNTVKPGGQPQEAHRDYHLGFQSPQTVCRFPLHAQVMSQFLTLQGAVAHSDMPLASGPTRLLPFSQRFEAGYQTYQHPEFQAYFESHHVQVPLHKGDALFLSPALYHAAGANTTDADRVANLLQVSSAFGRTMETVNTTSMAAAVYPALLHRVEAGTLTTREVDDVVAAAASGYSFPTDLDFDPPVDGNAPQTQQQLLRRALAGRWPAAKLCDELARQMQRRGSITGGEER